MILKGLSAVQYNGQVGKVTQVAPPDPYASLPQITQDTVISAQVNDNDNDTLREVPHPSNEGLALQARV